MMSAAAWRRRATGDDNKDDDNGDGDGAMGSGATGYDHDDDNDNACSFVILLCSVVSFGVARITFHVYVD